MSSVKLNTFGKYAADKKTKKSSSAGTAQRSASEDSGGTGDTTAKFKTFGEYAAHQKMGKSLKDWYEVGQDLATRYSAFYNDEYKSANQLSDFGSRYGRQRADWLSMADKYRDVYKSDSGAVKSIDAITGSLSGSEEAERQYADFMGQFKDLKDYNARYAYPKKYAKSSAAEVESRISELSKQKDKSASDSNELGWLQSNRYSYYTEKEIRQREKELEKKLKQAQADDEKLARQTGMFLGADSDTTASLKSQLAAVQNALRDSVYAQQVSKWDAEHRDKFYNSYGAQLNKIARETQATRVNMGDAVTGELDAARKGATEMEDYLRGLGYTEDQLSGLRAYAQSQNNLKRAYENSEYWQKVADKGFWGKVGASVVSVPANLMSGAAFVDAALHGLTNGKDEFTGEKKSVDYNASPIAYAGENMRAAVSRDMSSAGQFFYNTGMSIVDFLAARGVTKATGSVGKNIKALGKIGEGVGNGAEVMLAGSAANSSMRAAKDRGATDAEAIGFGFLSGLAEMAGEHMSIEHLNAVEKAMGKAASKRTVTNILKSVGMQSAVEGSEEGMTTLANTLSDFIVMGDRAEYNQNVEKYIADGETQETARRRALTDWLTGLALDMAGGALSGGITSGVTISVSAAHQKVSDAVVGWKDKESLHYLLTVDKALSYPEGSETRNFAEDLAARLDGATTLGEAKIRDGEIGKLIRLMTEEQGQLESGAETEAQPAYSPAAAFRPASVSQTEQQTKTELSAEPITLTPTAKAFEARGVDTKSAIERGAILDALLAGEEVSNSKLEKIGGLNDAAGQAVFTEITGAEIPKGLTASGLRKFYRAVAAEYVKQQALTMAAQESTTQAAEKAAVDVEAQLAEAMNPAVFDNNGQAPYNNLNETTQGGVTDAGSQSGVPTAGERFTAADTVGVGVVGDGDTGARLDEVPGGREVSQLVPEERNDGRGDTELHGVVRLSDAAKKSIADRGYTNVELSNVTSEPTVFSSALAAAREADTRNGWAVTPQDAADLTARGVKLLMNDDASSGLGITPDGDIIGVFKNPKSNSRRVLFSMLPTAIANGGKKLDCYGEGLVWQYAQFGFVPVARTKFDPEFANPGWVQEKGEPEIYFMMHNGDSADETLSKALSGEFEIFTQEYLDSLPEMSYEDAEAFRNKLIDGRVKLDDGTELSRAEFAEQLRKAVPDAEEAEINAMFADAADANAPLKTESETTEGHTESKIASEEVSALREDINVSEHVKVDAGVKLSRGQQWLAKFLASSLRRTGVISDIEISSRFGDDINGAIDRGVLTLNPKYLTPEAVSQRIIGHELLHAAIDRTGKTEKGRRDTKLVDYVFEALSAVDPGFNPITRVDQRTADYKAALAQQTNPRTNRPYTKTEIDVMVTEEYIREEIAADEVGKVFASQHMLNDFAGLRPGLIARAYMAADRIRNLRTNNSTEARAVKRYAKQTQNKLRAALDMAGSYEVENGESVVRASVTDKSWAKQMELGYVALGLHNVDGYTANDYAAAREELGDSCFVINEVPAILQELGLGNKPLTYTQTHFVNATLPIELDDNGRDVGSTHGIDEDVLNRLPELLGRPVMVLKSRKQDKTSGKLSNALIVVIDAYDAEGSPIGVAIQPHGAAVIDGVRRDSNHILSIYGLRHLADENDGANILRAARDNDGFLYVNSELTDKILRKIGQKKSAEPINSPEDTSKEYSADEAVSNAAGTFPRDAKDFSPRPGKLTPTNKSESIPLQRGTSLPISVAQTERVVNSRYKALAANPYLREVELDTVIPNSSKLDANSGVSLPESVMRDGYAGNGELLHWVKDGSAWIVNENAEKTSYLNMASPLILDCDGRDVSQLSDISHGRGATIDAIRDYVYENELKYDGVVLRNLSRDGYVADMAVTLTDAQAVPAREPEPVSDGGRRFSVAEREYAPTFYSKIERVIESQKQDKIGASSVVNMLRGKGVKAEEIKWSGIEAFLEGKKSVTKDELLGFVRGNQLQIDIIQLGGERPDTEFSVPADDNADDTHWRQYILDGGKNYRELLYTLPGSTYSNQAMDVHWNRAGVLAHARVQDFVNAENKKVLFVEEIQSDWHNAGKKSGYAEDSKTDARYKQLQARVLEIDAELDSGELAEIVKKLSILRGDNNPEYAKNYLASTAGRDEDYYMPAVLSADDSMRDRVYPTEESEWGYRTLTTDGLQQAINDSKIIAAWQYRWTEANAELRQFKWSMDKLAPDAPFRSNYTDFVLKDILRKAAEQGYDVIAWTTSAQQEARWSSEFAEGYRIEYDQDIPSFLRKYGKQWGAEVGYTLIGKDLTRSSAYRSGGMEAVMTIAANTADENGELPNGSYIVHSMNITDAMRESVLYEGQPRFSVKASDIGFTGEVRVADNVDVNEYERRKVASEIMSNTARIDGYRGLARTFDGEYHFEVYSDGSVEITDFISNTDLNEYIMAEREERRNAERYGIESKADTRRDSSRAGRRTGTYADDGHNYRGRSERPYDNDGREPGRHISRPRDGEPENTRQADVDAETDELFSADNAVRFAVTGGRTMADFAAELLRRREVSRVRSNTFERSGLFTRAELAMEGLRPADMQYDVVAERESMARARQRLEANYDGAKNELEVQRGEWSGVDLDTAMGILSQELDTARKSGDYSTAVKWAQRIRERGTNAGQMIQAFAKYTRTPEGVMVEVAEDLEAAVRDGAITPAKRDGLLKRIGSFSETLESIQTGDKEALIQLILKQAKQRNTPVSKKTLEAMRAGTTEFQFLYDTALTQLSQIAKDYAKTSFGRKVATFQTLSHLLNARTALRNLGSNNVFTLVDTVASNAAMLPDLMLNAITGRRTVGYDPSRLSKTAHEGAKAARDRSRIEVALDVAPATGKDKYGTSRRTWKMTGGKFAQAMSTAEKAMGFELNYTDESAKGAIRAQVMQSLKPFVDNGTLTTEEAQQFAEEEALYRTFQDETAVATLLGGLKRTLNTIGIGDGTALVRGKSLKTHDFGLGDIVVKYTQVPGALITRAYEFSPLGYAKAVVNLYDMFKARHTLNSRTDLSDKQKTELQMEQDRAQRRAALFIGRASTGSGLIALFAAAAARGLLHRGDDEDDPDAKALNAAMGMSGTQLNMSALSRWITGESTDWQDGDALASLDFLEPLNSLMAMGTLVARSDEGISVGEIALQSLPALVNAFSELSVMQTLRTIIDTNTYYTPDSGLGISNEEYDRFATVAFNVALSGATGFVPAPVRQLAQATDSSNRDAYGERGVWEKAKAQLANSIPFVRKTLPEKQTGFGEPKPTESALLRAVNAFAMPGTINTYKPSSAADELAAVYAATDEANIYPNRNAPYKITTGSGRDKIDYKLTASEREVYLRTRGQLSKQLIDAARASDAYQDADEYTKADMLVAAKNYANYVAKKAFFESRGIDFNADPTYESYSEMLASGVDLSSYLAYSSANNELEADRDEDGDPISGTKKAKTLDLIAEQNMDSSQKAALYFKAYPNERDDFDALGIDFDEYYTYARAMCTMTGDKDANGKTISGSKKEKVVALINSLNISSEAKTQLYLDNGYTARSIPRWS